VTLTIAVVGAARVGKTLFCINFAEYLGAPQPELHRMPAARGRAGNAFAGRGQGDDGPSRAAQRRGGAHFHRAPVAAADVAAHCPH